MSEQHPMFNPTPVAAPYAGTTGHSGSTASRDAAQAAIEGNSMAARQQRIMNSLRIAGPLGQTVADLRDGGANHHGRTSSALTALHKTGQIARLAEKRDNCHIYVLPEHVGGRVQVQPGSNRSSDRPRLTAAEMEWLGEVKAAVEPRKAETVLLKTATAHRLLAMIEHLNG